MAKQLTYTYEDKEYILEFNRETVCEVANRGVTDAMITMENSVYDAMAAVPIIWECAFLMHHPSTSKELIQKMYEKMDKGEQGELMEALVELYYEPLNDTLNKKGNVKWSKSW